MFCKKMLLQMLEDYKRLYSELAAGWDMTPALTLKEDILHARAKKCQYCGKKFNESISADRKVRHHRWSASVERSSSGEVLTGNYIAPLCNACNLRISEQGRIMPVFAHNNTRYDMRYIIAGINDDWESPFIVSKGGDNYLQLRVKEKRVGG